MHRFSYYFKIKYDIDTIMKLKILYNIYDTED